MAPDAILRRLTRSCGSNTRMYLFRKTRSIAEAERMATDPDIQQEALPSGHPPVSALAEKMQRRSHDVHVACGRDSHTQLSDVANMQAQVHRPPLVLSTQARGLRLLVY